MGASSSGVLWQLKTQNCVGIRQVLPLPEFATTSLIHVYWSSLILNVSYNGPSYTPLFFTDGKRSILESEKL